MSEKELTHLEVEALLAEYVARELKGPRAIQVTQHLDHCPQCQQKLLATQHIRHLLGLLATPVQQAANPTSQEAPSSLKDAILARLDEPFTPTPYDLAPELANLQSTTGPGEGYEDENLADDRNTLEIDVQSTSGNVELENDRETLEIDTLGEIGNRELWKNYRHVLHPEIATDMQDPDYTTQKLAESGDAPTQILQQASERASTPDRSQVLPELENVPTQILRQAPERISTPDQSHMLQERKNYNKALFITSRQKKRSGKRTVNTRPFLVAAAVILLLGSILAYLYNGPGMGNSAHDPQGKMTATPAIMASATVTGEPQNAVTATAIPNASDQGTGDVTGQTGTPGSTTGSANPGPTTGSTAQATPTASRGTQTWTQDITISAVARPDASRYQVQSSYARATTQPQTLTVNATGQGTVAGAASQAQIKITNSGSALQWPAGTSFTSSNNNNYSIVLDQAVDLPAGTPDSAQSVTVSAHFATVGTGGNLGANAFVAQSNTASSASVNWSMTNITAFSGGTDPQSYIYVQQSDLDAVTRTLDQHAPRPQGMTLLRLMQSNLPSNEHLLPGGSSSCQGTTTTNQKAGDHAASVTATITYTCSMSAYDYRGALAAAARSLNDQASNHFGRGYTLISTISTTLQNEQITSSQQNTASATIRASGTWRYR